MTLRLKGLGKRQVENFYFIEVVSYFFHLHSQMGNNSRIKTYKVFRLPLSTIGTWFEKRSNILIWLPIVNSLSLKSVLKYIPISPISNSSFKGYEMNVTMSKRMICGVKQYDTKYLLNTKTYFGVTTDIH